MSHDPNLQQTWHASEWIPGLNIHNVMDYFSEPTNPFYNRHCNNQTLKMQRINPDQLVTMTGLEYELIHVQDPILFVIRAQHRHSKTQVTPLANYYIIAGHVYQAPDLGSVVNSRLLNCIHNLESAFEESHSFSRYHPSKGYWWEFKDHAQTEMLLNKDKKNKKEEPSSFFQRQRVDQLLTDLAQKFPPKTLLPPVAATIAPEKKEEHPIKSEVKIEIKTERATADRVGTAGSTSKPPPEKKMKLIR